MRYFSRLVRSGVATLLALSLATPGFASPYSTPTPILSEGFEEAPSAYSITNLVDATHPGTSYWGRITERKKSGVYGLWVAATTASRTSYAVGTGGFAKFSLPQLADYFASELKFDYTMLSRGQADGQSFKVSWFRPEAEGDDEFVTDFPLTASNSWNPRTYDMSTMGDAKMSRVPGTVQFLFQDFAEGFGQSVYTGQGPTIDDVVISGWKYGPVRDLSAAIVDGSVQLSWARPYRALGSTTPEERQVSYRVWRAPAYSTSWTEVTQGRLGDSALSYTAQAGTEGTQQRFSVQAWDPSGTAYGRAAEVTVTVPSVPPSVTLAAPTDWFPVTVAPVRVVGTAYDGGSGVASVQVRVRRADGMCWSGAAWTATDSWLNATTTNGWSNWTYTWNPDMPVLSAGRMVTISARAVDKSGLVSELRHATSASMAPPTARLAYGARYSTESSVAAWLDAPGATHVRVAVGNGPFGPWVPHASRIPVNLGAEEGTRTVTFQFSVDGATVSAQELDESNVSGQASDSILLHRSIPQIAVTAPSDGYSLAAPVIITGTSSDVGSFVSAVDVLIRRADGACWNGTTWGVAQTWLPASTNDGFANWTYDWTPNPGDADAGQIVSILARARDAFGLSAIAPSVGSVAAGGLSASLAEGAEYARAREITASLSSAISPSTVRYSVDGGEFTQWMPYAPKIPVTLTAGDGLKTVSFEAANGLSTAAASDTIVLHTSVPTVSIDASVSGFSLAGTVTVSGRALDGGGEIDEVALRILRSDGNFWDGDSWVEDESWDVTATVDEAGNWRRGWYMDMMDADPELPASVVARVTDKTGLIGYSDTVLSSKPTSPSISIEHGARYSGNASVSVEATAVGAKYMRTKIGTATPSAWVTYTAETTVSLPASEGPHVVQFDFASDPNRGYRSAVDSISLDFTGPQLLVERPVLGFNPEELLDFRGAATDAASGLSAVRLRITRLGKYWNGEGWQDSEWWLKAGVDNGAWTFPWTAAAAAWNRYEPVTVEIQALDEVGNAASAKTVSIDPKEPTKLSMWIWPTAVNYAGKATITATLKNSAGQPLAGKAVRLQYYAASKWNDWSTKLSTDASGVVSYVVAPVNKTSYRVYFPEDDVYLADGPTTPSSVTPKVSLTKPSAPSSIKFGSSFTSVGYLKPRHTTPYPVRVYRERYVGGGKWKSYGYVRARGYNSSSYTKYSVKISLPAKGKWRLKAYTPADSLHQATYSALSRTVVVK